MVWFLVDDGLGEHPKVNAAGLEAIGLWTVCGAYCNRYQTEGFVPDWYVKGKPRGLKLAARLVAANLWHPAVNDEGLPGWQFHQWRENGQRTKEQVEHDREAARIRKQRSRERTREIITVAHARSHGVTLPNGHAVTDAGTHTVTDAETPARSHGAQASPGQSRPEEHGGYVPAEPQTRPSEHCDQHPGGTRDACGACGRARTAATAWDRTRGTERVNRRRAEREAAILDRQQCTLCDADGYRLTPNGPGMWCNHQPLNPGGLKRALETIQAEKGTGNATT